MAKVVTLGEIMLRLQTPGYKRYIQAQSFDVEEVRIASKGLSFTAPEGTVTIDGFNQHLYKQVRIGKINDKGLIDEIWATPGSIKPDPYLSTYEWARGIQD